MISRTDNVLYLYVYFNDLFFILLSAEISILLSQILEISKILRKQKNQKWINYLKERRSHPLSIRIWGWVIQNRYFDITENGEITLWLTWVIIPIDITCRCRAGIVSQNVKILKKRTNFVLFFLILGVKTEA